MTLRVLLLTSVMALSSLAAPVKSRLASAETDYLSPLPPLPHGAIPVEYIESTGTQYIDTGVIPLNGFQLDCQLQVTKFNDGAFGVMSRNTSRNCYLNFYSQKIYPRFGAGFPSGSKYISFRKVAIVFNRQDLYIDGDGGGYTFNNINDAIQIYPFYLFAYNHDGIVSGYCLMRLFNITLSNYGEVEFDAIPVRFPNELGEWEGAMYDFVSGELFRNQGTGSFVIGPDL